ncbi:MAG: Calx-beta domain-containing protein, partial [Sulfurimonas sp.]|nr:Calx-beta domain-containing protein [Sulfurimonas sp.]
MKPFNIFTKLVPICGLMMMFAVYGWGNDIASADDICYDSVTTEETTVLPGTTFYGTTIILRNIGEENLSDVTIIKSFSDIDMSLMSSIKLDGTEKTIAANDDSAEVNQTLTSTFSSSALEGLFDKGIIYYPDGNGSFNSEETHTIYDYSTFSFAWENVSLNALFTKGTAQYKAKINACPIIIKFPLEIYQISENYSATVGSTSLLETRVTLSKAVTYDIAFDYTTIDGTALAGSDFIAVSGRITIPAGETETKISIPIYHDIEIELQESFTLKISNVTPSTDVQIGTNPTEIQILEQSAENLPVCYEDDFNDGSLDDKWRTLGTGFTPIIVDSRLQLTPAAGGTTAVTKDYEFPSKYNMIVVEFDQFAYGGNRD